VYIYTIRSRICGGYNNLIGIVLYFMIGCFFHILSEKYDETRFEHHSTWPSMAGCFFHIF